MAKPLFMPPRAPISKTTIFSNFRIDFIYYKGPNTKPIDSRVINQHPDPTQMFPSDHAGVLTIFEIN